MASLPVTLAVAVGAALFLTVVGSAVARLAGAWTGSASAAPALGWAVFVALALPLHLLVGFTHAATLVVAGIALAAALAVLARTARDPAELRLPWPAFALAAAVAFVPLVGLLPKLTEGGVLLGPAVSDHSKVAMIDAMTRLGLPAANPFFAAHGARGVLSYYYLWHFGAADLALAVGVSGWTADAALTGVTAYASLLLMMGLSVRFHPMLFGGTRPRPLATVAAVALLALTGTLRPLLGATLGWDTVNRIFANYRDLESWMSQACWVPQHLAAANSALLVILLLPALTTKRPAAAVVAGIAAAASFGSSAWIGGVTLAVAASGVGGAVVWRASAAERWRFAAAAASAMAIAAVVALPLVVAEFGTLAARHGGAPVAFHPFEVLGGWLGPGLRRGLDLPAFWLVLLPVDLPAVYPAAAAALIARLRPRGRRPAGPGPVDLRPVDPRPVDPRLVDLAVVAGLSLTISWLLISTIGNNDLGWRAMLLPTMILLPVAATALVGWIARREWLAGGAALLLVALSFPERIALGGLAGRASGDAEHFAAEPALWAAVRHYAGPADRVANNPLDLDDLTSFPVNIGWALLSGRSSCYGGWETSQVYVDLPKPQVRSLDDRFIRVFAGTGDAGDIRALADDYGCRLAVVTDADGAWDRDPFAASPYYRLAERAEAWRVYVRR